jgi:PKHD-type hydroxylase
MVGARDHGSPFALSMVLHIPQVLDAAQTRFCRQRLDSASWADGCITAGHQSGRVKRNLQLPESDPIARELSALVLDALASNTTFFASALPRHIFPPLFNCYGPGNAFGAHIDNAVRYDRSTQPVTPVRTDLSATLFLNEPEEYDGGELVIEERAGERRIKLAAGDMVLYPASTVHRVEPISRGFRLASFFWIQSLVRADHQRSLLLDLDSSIQSLTARVGEDPALIELTGLYHNLLRCWTDT